jgi:peptide deformylase
VILKIRQAGEPVLRQRAQALTPEQIRSGETQRLIEWMRETMHDAPGVGLAAPQIGLPLQLAVIEDRAAYIEKMPPKDVAERRRVPVPFHVIINPKLTLVGEQRPEFYEGCLSVAGLMAIVPRAFSVHVEAMDEHAEPVVIDATGWYARILQHEIDHLHGTLYIDRMRSRSFTTVENHNRYLKDLPPSELAELLSLPAD